jgi:hypothetical protein
MNTWTFLIIAAPLLAAYGYAMHLRGFYKGVDAGSALSTMMFYDFLQSDEFYDQIEQLVEADKGEINADV